MVGLMMTSSNRAYATCCVTQACCSQSPCLHRRHSNAQKQVWLSLHGVSGSWCSQDFFKPSKHLWQVWSLILNMILPIIPSCWGVSFALGHGVSFFSGIEHSSINGCLAVRCNFGVLTGDECTSLCSAILVSQGDTCSLEKKLQQT